MWACEDFFPDAGCAWTVDAACNVLSPPLAPNVLAVLSRHCPALALAAASALPQALNLIGLITSPPTATIIDDDLRED